ncbi:sigma-70 family RNA polymerase sigma factor [Mycobacterium sp.]|uniref:sigma-70 family RNA polymerase sigma factor n=1 Tax=Mycobacterium sp. TaxID=1785 RepID=UPI003BAA9828
MRKRSRSDADTDDITQDVLLRFYENSEHVDNPIQWMYAVARNAAIDYYRRSHHREIPAGTEAMIELPAEYDPTDNTTAEDLAACLAPLLDTLPAVDKQTLTLTYLQGQTQRQVAQELGISVSGMKSRVQRSRQKLLNAINECCTIILDKRGHPIDMQAKQRDS